MKRLLFIIFFSVIVSSLIGQDDTNQYKQYDSIIHMDYSSNIDDLEPRDFNHQIEKYIVRSKKLNNSKTKKLIQLINNSSLFNQSECGTPLYEGAFKLYINGSNNATIYYACDKTQMYFSPKNFNSKYGALNVKGQKLLNKIYANNNRDLH